MHLLTGNPGRGTPGAGQDGKWESSPGGMLCREKGIKAPSIPGSDSFFGDGWQKTCKGDVGIDGEASTAFPTAIAWEKENCKIPQLTRGAPEVWGFFERGED